MSSEQFAMVRQLAACIQLSEEDFVTFTRMAQMSRAECGRTANTRCLGIETRPLGCRHPLQVPNPRRLESIFLPACSKSFRQRHSSTSLLSMSATNARPPTAPPEPVLDPYQALAKAKRFSLSTASPFTPAFVQSHLPPRPPPAAAYAARVKGKPLILENPARESRAKQLRDEREARREKEKKRKESGVMGRREAKRTGVWEIDRRDARWELFLPINRLWLGYIAELLSLAPPPPTPAEPTTHKMPNSAAMQAKLVKADLHGCILSVRRAKNPDLVGRGGIVVHETENTFKVVTTADKLKVLPKRNSIFVFRIPLYATTGLDVSEDQPQMEFELYGNQLCFRASERASRKFKFKETIEL